MIESITPKKWVADKDERLLGPGEMSFAKNVIVSERTEGTLGVLKTMKGTSEVQAVFEESTVDTSDWVVLGSVVDSQRNYMYLFVNDEAEGDSGRIVMVDPDGFSWQTILHDGILFKRGNNVVGSVVNKAFQQDGVVQSVLYFTDNHYQPYKINVDRAIAGDYADVNDAPSQANALHTIKGTAWKIPSVGFETDEDFSGNNFKSDVFQFAVQYLYKDGEESALSGYSKLAVSPYLANKGLSIISSGSDTGNVCVIGDLWNNSIGNSYTEVTKVRLLARVGNSDPFYIIDDFDPREDKIRYVGGNSRTVYNSASFEYKFYNDQYYTTISETTSQKIYDNVPQTAEGQAISGNRLMYSNYTEGYENVSIDGVTFTATYGDATTTGGVFHVSAVGAAATAIRIAGSSISGETPVTAEGDVLKGDVFVDLTSSGFVWPSPNDHTSTVPAGTITRLGFTYQPRAEYYNNTNGISLITGCENISTGDTFDLRLAANSGEALNTGVSGTIDIQSEARFLLEYTSDSDETVDSLCDNIRSKLSSENNEATMRIQRIGSATVSGIIENSTASTGSWSDGNSVVFNNCTLDVTFGFNDTDVSGSNDGDFVIEPYVKRIRVISHQVGDLRLTSGSYTDNPSSQADNTIASIDTAFGNPVDTYVKNLSQNIFSVAPTDSSSFKAGSSHDFGIVLFDRYGRSGFVNEIGSTYIDHTGERGAGVGKGASQLTVNFTSNITLPDWAYSWAPVYGGSQFADVFQYTTGGGYVVKETASPYDNIDADKRIYVSLKTLTQHREKTSSTRNYSFTKGDICRVISYKRASDGERIFPSTNKYGGGIVEFEVLGVETLSADGGNPIQGSSASEDTQGDFLVLRAPEIEGGFKVDTDGDGTEDTNLQYEGFDWFSMTGAASYPIGINPNSGTLKNYWGQECIIEILTSKKSSDTNVYYEFGVQNRVGANPTPFGSSLTLIDGDVRLRTISCVTPEYNGSTFNKTEPEDWVFVPFALEDLYPSEFFTEKAWNKGRAHVKFDRAATVNRYNGITYSNVYADDTSVLSLSSFTPSTANFFDLPSEHGACKFIGMSGDNLISIQENKVSRISVNKEVIETGTQSGLLSLSSSPLNNLVSYVSDFGTQNPESVTIRDGVIYFADLKRSALIRVSNSKGMSVLSDVDCKSYFDEKLRFETKVVSGYDPDDELVFFSFGADNSSAAWSEKYQAWISTYTFEPNRFATISGSLFALGPEDVSLTSATTTNNIAHQFADNYVSNKFMNQSATASEVNIVFNNDPNSVKVYQSLSIDGDTSWTTYMLSSEDHKTNNLNFLKKEGLHYAYIGVDSTEAINSSKYLPIGEVYSLNVGDPSVTMVNNIRGIHIPLGYSIAKQTSTTTTDIANCTVTDVTRSNATIDLSTVTGITVGDNLVCFANGDITGDKVRGNWVKAVMTYTPSGSPQTSPESAQNELHAVNAHYKNSMLNHGGTQQ